MLRLFAAQLKNLKAKNKKLRKKIKKKSSRNTSNAAASNTIATTTTKPEKSSYVSFPKLKKDTVFGKWYLKVISNLTDPRFVNLYDPSRDDVILDGSVDPEANSQLYRSLLNTMDDKIVDSFLERTYLRGDGVALLDAIKQKFQRKWNRLERNSKMRDRITLKQNKDENIDDFSIRVSRMSKQVILNGCTPMINELRDKFILGLRSKHFLEIQKRVDDLPPLWTTRVYTDLPLIAQAYLDNAVELEGTSDAKKQPSHNDDDSSRQSSRSTNGSKDQRRQRAIHAAIMAGTFRVQDYLHQVQPGAYIYHGRMHRGGIVGCNNLAAQYKKAENLGVQNTPLATQIALLEQTQSVLHNHYQQRQNMPPRAPMAPPQQPRPQFQQPYRPPQQQTPYQPSPQMPYQTYYQKPPATANYTQFESLSEFLQQEPIPSEAMSSLTENYSNNTGPRYSAFLTQRSINLLDNFST